MTQTVDPQTSTDPGHRTDAWLSRFQAALEAGDAPAAADLFATECYWRDLVSFTWNITTVEGRDGVADLLERDPRAAPTRPASRIDRAADEADGVTDGVVQFETAVGRGRGLLRLVEEDGPGVDVAHHALRAEGPRGAARRAPPDGRRARRQQAARDLEGAAASRRPRASAAPPSPTCWSSAAARAASPSAPGCGSSACRRLVIDKHPGPATSGAAATSRCACTTRSGTTTCPTSSSPRTGRCSRPRTRSATGWSPTPR